MAHLDFYFDLSSPWTYLAFHNVQAVLARTGASITYKPILVGGVFNAVNPALYEKRADTDSPAARHSGKVMQDWARLAGVTLNFPSRYHPAKSVNAMRMACALESDQLALAGFIYAAFEAYFVRMDNLDDPDVLAAAAVSAGLDGAALKAAIATDAIKAKLRANTEELVNRGGFGSPTLFVNGDDMFFGNDQLPVAEAALRR